MAQKMRIKKNGKSRGIRRKKKKSGFIRKTRN